MTQPTSGWVAPTQRRLPGASTPVRAGRADSAGAAIEPGIAWIAVDLLGGDRAPAVVVDGALRACGADPDVHLLLVGPSAVADEVIVALAPADRDRIRVRATSGPVAVDASGRTHSTVRAAVAAVGEGQADALVSAGASGASVAAAALLLGRWPGCRRPALAATLPAVGGPVVLLDVGASPDAGPATLVRHALMGAAYAAVVHGIATPRVGLLSIGSEAGKGDRTRRAAGPLLAAARLPAAARYIGLVEGQEPCLGTSADVVVTDGFTGNVLLKGIEGAYAMAGGREAAAPVPRAAALLGVGGTVVVCHGAATGADLASGIALAAHLHRRAAMTAVAAMIGVASETNVSSGAHESPR